MAVHAGVFRLATKGFTDVHDITTAVQHIVAQSRIRDGIVAVCVPGSTAGITTIEYESGAVEDLRKAIERLAPSSMNYDHDDRWGDGNGFAHVRAALLGPSLALPLHQGELALGTWQQIVLVDFDNRPRQREVRVTVTGE